MKVNQYDLNNNYIHSFNSYAETARVFNCDESTIRKAVKFNKKVFGKFRFTVGETIDSDYTVNTPKNTPRILFLDIETSPLLAFVYQKQVWKARIGHKQVVSDYFMLTWSAKFFGETEVHSDGCTGEEAYAENDERIVKNLWLLMDEADIIVAHNGDSFDIPNINARFVYWKLFPPSPYRQIDTLRIAQKHFGFTHNSLDALCDFFDVPGKIETNFELWKACVRGEDAALIEMEVYNRQDVKSLESVFHKIKGYAKGLPNMDLYQDTEYSVCPCCGSETIKAMDGKYFYTQAVKYQAYRCESCGSISRSKTGIKFENKKLISAIPR